VSIYSIKLAFMFWYLLPLVSVNPKKHNRVTFLDMFVTNDFYNRLSYIEHVVGIARVK
jgi:hypothetical protein